jgi:hypothetical protein
MTENINWKSLIKQLDESSRWRLRVQNGFINTTVVNKLIHDNIERIICSLNQVSKFLVCFKPFILFDKKISGQFQNLFVDNTEKIKIPCGRN